MMRATIQQLIASIKPFDYLETEHISNAIKWINSEEEIFRLQKPATPPKHLVSYFAILDRSRNKILLMDHINAGKWLPAGGHVEKDEHPKAAVEREIKEELDLTADFIDDHPFFITQTTTVNTGSVHIDVSLWYILNGNSEKEIAYDPQEFNGYKWFDHKEILKADTEKFDPHIHRFIKKALSDKILL